MKTVPVTLLKQGSFADIFVGMFRLFFPSHFTKHLSTTNWEGSSFVYRVKSLLLRQAATLITFRILVKSHKSLKGIKSFARRYSIKKIKKSRVTGKNLWWNPFIIKLQSPTSQKKNFIAGVFLLLFLNFSEQLLGNGCFWRNSL